MTGIYQIAGKTVEIRSQYPAVHILCGDYASEGAPELVVSVAPEDILREREISDREDAAENRPLRSYSDSYLETLVAYRQIAEHMPAWDTVLLHGSAVAVDGTAYLFAARSGIGKSTHARLWRELLGDRARMVNDDKPLVRVGGGEAIVFGTPWNGKHRLGENIAAPLRAVCFLQRAEENRIRPVSPAEAYPELVRQTYRPADPAMMAKTLELLDKICASVSFWRLGCNMDIEAAQVAYEAMKG